MKTQIPPDFGGITRPKARHPAAVFDAPDGRYAPWWLPLCYFVLTLIGLGVIAGVISNEVRDLQRRIGTLEQQSK